MNLIPRIGIQFNLVASVLILCFTSGCGNKPATDTSAASSSSPPATASKPAPAPVAAAPKETPPPTPAKPVEKPQPTAGKATLVGHVSFLGDPPKPKVVNMIAEKKCHDTHKTPPTDESVMVSADKSLKGVLVRIAGKVPGDYPPPTEPVVVDQVGCVFIPHVLAVQVGQPIVLKNSDEVAHNVRLDSKKNLVFNSILPKKGDTMEVNIKNEEIGMKVKCDVHFWMACNIHAMRHPFFQVTDETGNFKIENLPPGEYKLEAVHESLGKQSRDISAKDGEVMTVDYEFAAKK